MEVAKKTNMSESDAFADKTSLICLKNSIIIYIMTLKMTVMLLSSRYRREIKDSKKWLLCILRIRLEQLAKMTTASLLSRRGLRQAATRIMIRSKNTTERSTNTIRQLNHITLLSIASMRPQ